MRSMRNRGGAIVAAALMLAAVPMLAQAGDRATGAEEAEHEADNTGRNQRDRKSDTLTADDQSNDERDVEITRLVRRAITKDDSLSTNAHNVKIITSGGVVTLRGPVETAAEKTAIAKMAKTIDGVSEVDNQLEVVKP